MKEPDNSFTPYVGLVPYSEKEAQFFFGRESEREIITANLLASRLTLLYGESGVGKSSVLRAGVAHHLRQKVQQDATEQEPPEFTVVVFSSWRDDPVAKLQERIRQEVEATFNGRKVKPVPPSPSLSQSLYDWTERTGSELLIILDQFEEYFLYHPKEEGEGTFAIEFPRAVNRPDLRVSFLVAFRADSLDKLDFFKSTIPSLYDNYLRIEHLGYKAARAAIEKPLEQYNKLHKSQVGEITIEPQLINAVLQQVSTDEKLVGDTGSGSVKIEVGSALSSLQIETPYLQLVMTRLWEEEMKAGSRRLRLATLEQLGGTKRIVQAHLDSVMSKLSEDEQEIGFSIFKQLVTPSGTKIAQTVPDLAEFAGRPEPEVKAMLEQLSAGGPSGRILRPVEPPPGQPQADRYEIYHDVLAAAILKWRKEYGHERQLAAERAEKEKQLEEKQKAERQLAREKQLVRRQRWLVILLAVLLVAMTALTGYAFWQHAKVEAANVELDEQTKTAIAAKDEAEHLRGIADEQSFRLTVSNKQLEATYAQLEAKNASLLKQTQVARAAQAEANRQKSIAEGEKKNAIEAKNRAVEEADNARKAETKAEEQRKIAEEQKQKAVDALAIVKEQDSAQDFYKTVFRDYTRPVTSATFTEDGAALITTSDDGKVQQREIQSDEGPNHQQGAEAARPVIAFSPDHRFRLGLENDKVQLRDMEKGPVGESLNNIESGLKRIAFSPDSKFVVAVFDTTGLLLNTEDGRVVAQLYGDKTKISAIAFGPGGRSIVTGHDDGRVQLWDGRTGQKQNVQGRGLKAKVTSVSYDHSGNYIIAGAQDGSVVAWLGFVMNGMYIPLGSHKDEVNLVAFSPDNTYAVTASKDRTLKVWPTKPWRTESTSAQANASVPAASPPPSFTLEHKKEINHISFSPDSRYVVTSSADNLARVWDLRAMAAAPLEGSQGRISAVEIRGHTRPVNYASFSADSRLLATAGDDATARVWDLSSLRGGFRVEQVTLKANPIDFEGDCPVTINFQGAIIATGGNGEVTYRFVRSDGAKSAPQILKFDAPGSQTIGTTWRLGELTEPFSGWIGVEIINPQISGLPVKANFKVRCSLKSDVLVSSLCGPVFYRANSPILLGEHRACLEDIALQMVKDQTSSLVIDGHRDRPEDKDLSRVRANNARDYLVNEKGIDSDRIRVRDISDNCPHESGDPALNRRVEFWILPKGASVSDIPKRCGGAKP